MQVNLFSVAKENNSEHWKEFETPALFVGDENRTATLVPSLENTADWILGEEGSCKALMIAKAGDVVYCTTCALAAGPNSDTFRV
jgi:hypothetical protein